jgi:hypothetical protein
MATRTPSANTAFFFIKPHANVPAVEALVREVLGEKNIRIVPPYYQWRQNLALSSLCQSQRHHGK